MKVGEGLEENAEAEIDNATINHRNNLGQICTTQQSTRSTTKKRTRHFVQF